MCNRQATHLFLLYHRLIGSPLRTRPLTCISRLLDSNFHESILCSFDIRPRTKCNPSAIYSYMRFDRLRYCHRETQI